MKKARLTEKQITRILQKHEAGAKWVDLDLLPVLSSFRSYFCPGFGPLLTG
ncbi:MAG: hypothetical protein JG765_2357 [Cereibacter sp.]|jgi:hypothetical protein|nr:hypothetical protein [Cereibacter sp.]